MNHSTHQSLFTTAERRRLGIYKAAVAAGFFTDSAPVRPDAFHFTADELQRLEIYRAAVAAGFYTDRLGNV